ncbi:efflux RND transporter periplasmic adaptor subunit [Vaginisenegalia massiliensis]|uniref:efflux RND transporter periplasmic adaptor subunit n=1 Tax=Vaginisenegalia massiliensis TaxID=2058294 RepID=UPI000F534999|nr:efflux RND transporter periplasmic adaptor subunit [Vaginisenegalia massiliensis]
MSFKQMLHLKSKWWMSIIIAAIYLVLLIASLSSSILANDPKEPIKNADNSLDLYQVEKASPIKLEAIAIPAKEQVYHWSSAKGQVGQVFVKVGDEVEKGQELFSYQQNQLNYDIEDCQRQQTQLYNLRENYIELLSELTQANYNYRGDRLVKSAKNGSNQTKIEAMIDYIDLKHWQASQEQKLPSEASSNSQSTKDRNSKVMLADEVALQNEIRKINHQIEDVEINPQRLQSQYIPTEKAPFSGEIRGDLVNQSPNGQDVIFRLVSNQQSCVQGQVSEYTYPLIKSSQSLKVNILVENRTVDGRLFQITPVLSNNKNGQVSSSFEEREYQSNQVRAGQFQYEIAVEGYIQPGYSVEVELDDLAYKIPESSIYINGNQLFLWIYQDGKYLCRKVKGQRQEDHWLIYQGIKEGDRVVLHPKELNVKTKADIKRKGR